MSAHQCWHLARLWYQGRMDLDWDRPAPEDLEAIFREVGLPEPFWSVR